MRQNNCSGAPFSTCCAQISSYDDFCAPSIRRECGAVDSDRETPFRNILNEHVRNAFVKVDRRKAERRFSRSHFFRGQKYNLILPIRLFLSRETHARSDLWLVHVPADVSPWFSFAPDKSEPFLSAWNSRGCFLRYVLKTHFHATFSLRFAKFAHSGINYLTVNQYRVVALKESFSFENIKARIPLHRDRSCVSRCERQCYTTLRVSYSRLKFTYLIAMKIVIVRGKI